jgi:hypothetical protein
MQYKTVCALPLSNRSHANSSDDVASFNAINMRLLNAAAPLRHIPLRVYIPQQAEGDIVGSFKIVQALIMPRTEKREFQSATSLRHVANASKARYRHLDQL